MVTLAPLPSSSIFLEFQSMCKNSLTIIGAGPAGLMAAEAAATSGCPVHIYDSMPTIGRKFLMAGKGGLNLTHSEDFETFVARFGSSSSFMRPFLAEFGPTEIIRWCHDLGIETFVGTSHRVFPKDFKAAPLLRAWQRRLKAMGVRFHQRHRWLGWDEREGLLFQTPTGPAVVQGGATLLALGGGSWPRLGSDGQWVHAVIQAGIACVPLAPSNCGFDAVWSDHIRQRFAGQPLKSITLRFLDACVKGDVMITDTGVEGSPVYALSARLRDYIAAHGAASVTLDLCPDRSIARVIDDLSKPQGSRSRSSHLKRHLGLSALGIALLHEPSVGDIGNVQNLAHSIKFLPIALTAPRPLAEAISSAGGVAWAEMDETLMVKRRPGLFIAGEMLDWEAPTGGYLLTGCLATGHKAGLSAAHYVKANAG